MTYSKPYLETLIGATAKQAVKTGLPLRNIIALDFNDGVDLGLVVFDEQCVVRATSIGESRLRCYRAFILEVLEINETLNRDIAYLLSESPERLFCPGLNYNGISSLREDCLKARSVSHYIAIGSPWLDWIVLKVIDPATAALLRSNERDQFKCAHKVLSFAFAN